MWYRESNKCFIAPRSFLTTMNKLSATVTLFLVICINLGVFASSIVEIKNGTLEGIFERTRKGREFSAFKGIPYALPPIGELRFQPSKPASSWSGNRDAKKDSESCVQNYFLLNRKEILGSEDCLYLNVYTPKTFREDDEDIKYPVMVWIHGGGWMCGSGDSTVYSPKFLLDKDIVLVTINYRLGPLGFLSTGDDVIRGNQGLKDQVQALRWVQENIAAFGGDHKSVTLFGESAGGASGHFLMLSPLAKGLFHRVISQSATVRGPWALCTRDTAKSQARRLGEALNCAVDNSEELRDCLLQKDPIEITAVDEQWLVFGPDPLVPFKPVIEVNLPGAFLTQHPEDILKTGNLVDIPWMTGIVKHEGAIRTAAIYGNQEQSQVQQLNDDFFKLAPVTLAFDRSCPQEKHHTVSKMIRNYYLGDKPIDESTRFDVIDMYTDALFTVSSLTAAREHLTNLGSPVYFYLFAYRGSRSWSYVLGDSKRDHGVCHMDDLLYLFPQHELIFPNIQLSNDDEKMIDILTTLWYNFAKTGNPTPEITKDLPVKWKPVRTDAVEYLSIDSPRDIKMSKDLWKDRLEFWNSLPCKAGLSIPTETQQIRDEL